MKEDTRTTIMETAIKLFADKGFSDTSMSKIANQADVGKGTIYWHFESKEDLFLSIIEEKGKSYFNQVLKLGKSDMKPADIIYKYIRDRIEFIENNYDVARMLISNTDVINRDFKDTMEKRHKQMVQVLENTIQKGIEKGTFRAGKSDEYALMIINTTNSAHNNFSCGIKGDIETRTKKIYDFIMHGLDRREPDNEKK
ncbi:MAG TPA: TetR/AcrR family transcriptional regulator [Halanaerobiales bacterium]|nr:TetR/AcrR family transcriptional regulator [Halanaerobiales bacterium]